MRSDFFIRKGLACSFSGESGCLLREVLFLSKTRYGYQRGRGCGRGQIGKGVKLLVMKGNETLGGEHSVEHTDVE